MDRTSRERATAAASRRLYDRVVDRGPTDPFNQSGSQRGSQSGSEVHPPPTDAAVSEWLRTLRRAVFAEVLEPVRAASEAGRGSLVEGVRLGLETLLRQTEPLEAGVRDFVDAGERSRGLLASLPEIARLARLDAQAAFEGDPAATSLVEVVLCYPGVRTLVAHRFAHMVRAAGHPLLARMLAEAAHRETGIDIHPGAEIGESCFIDHGTGVVIGETAVIGRRCRIYQGVTLGARSFPRDEAGRMVRGAKRHPTLEDDVVVYANATILGGDTVIGRGSEIAGGAFVTASVAEGHIAWTPRHRSAARPRT